VTVKAELRRLLSRVPGAVPLARLTLETVRVCLRYRVTGLASEAGFFALLSLPPLLLGLFGGVGYVGQWLGEDTVEAITTGIKSWAETFLTAPVISDLLVPTIDDVFTTGRFELISVGFLLSLWSGSRALNVFVDTIAIMYGQSGVRGIVQTRALSFTLYLFTLLLGVVVIPLVFIGPTWLGQILPRQVGFLSALYWPVVTLLAVLSLAALFHVSTPRRSPWLRDLPGAVLTMVIWALASFVVRAAIASSLNGTSIYGPLSTPIVLLIWLYALAIAVLIGAALNAAIRKLYPADEFHIREAIREAVFGSRRGESGEPGGVVAPGAVALARPGVATLGETQRENSVAEAPAPADVTAAYAGESPAYAGEGAVHGGESPAYGKGKRPLTPLPEEPADPNAGSGAESAAAQGNGRGWVRRPGTLSSGRPRTPATADPGGVQTGDGRFGDGEKDRLMSLRTHSGE
jgi:membrane protein